MRKLEEEVSQSEAALGPTCGQGVKCAPVSSLSSSPCIFFFLSHLWAVVWGDGRLGGLSSGPSPSQEGGPPQLSVRAVRASLSVCYLTALQNASQSLLQNPWIQPPAPDCLRSRLSEAQASVGSGSDPS